MKQTVTIFLPGVVLFALVTFLVVFGSGHASQLAQGNQVAQSQQNSDIQLTKSLIDEVRLLRLAIERSQVNSVVMQAVLERTRSQQEQVNFIAQRLYNVRNEIASSQGALPRFVQSLAEIENRIKAEEDEKAKVALQRDYKDTQTAYEQQKLLEEQQRIQADSLASQLQSEQSKLNQLNDQLDRLEQEAKSQSKPTGAKLSK